MRTAGSRDLIVRDATLARGYWIEPGTRDRYPVSYRAYRDKREAQDRRPARHRRFAPDIDHYLWRHQRMNSADVEVVLALQPDAPPRVQRLVTEVLGAIRRGRSASDAIRSVARRFGLRDGRARAFITAGITVERRRLDEARMPVEER